YVRGDRQRPVAFAASPHDGARSRYRRVDLAHPQRADRADPEDRNALHLAGNTCAVVLPVRDLPDRSRQQRKPGLALDGTKPTGAGLRRIAGAAPPAAQARRIAPPRTDGIADADSCRRREAPPRRGAFGPITPCAPNLVPCTPSTIGPAGTPSRLSARPSREPTTPGNPSPATGPACCTAPRYADWPARHRSSARGRARKSPACPAPG